VFAGWPARSPSALRGLSQQEREEVKTRLRRCLRCLRDAARPRAPRLGSGSSG